MRTTRHVRATALALWASAAACSVAQPQVLWRVVIPQDVPAFLNAWGGGDSRADFNGDGVIDTRDVLAFLNAWKAGC